MLSQSHQLSTRGFSDWLIQRVSAIWLALYTAVILIYLLAHPQLSYGVWLHFMQRDIMMIATIITAIAILAHAWIGLWTVFTDYVKPRAVRYLLQTIVMAILLLLLFWVIVIV